MASIKISELNELEEASKQDLLVIVDVANNETKKIQAKNFAGGTTIPVSATPPENPEDGALWVDTNDNVLKKYNLTKAQWEVVGGAITGDTLPIGAIIPFGGTEAPTGWLICDGSMLNRETYKELFAAIGTNFGTDGPGNFYIPDLRGKVAVGQDTTDSDFGMGVVGGSKYIQDHQHLGIKWAGPNGQNINMNAGTGGVQIEPNSWQGGNGTDSPIYSGKVFGIPTGNSGNLQPYQVTNYIIKAFQSAGVVAQVSNTKSESTTDTYSCDYQNKTFGGTILYENSTGELDNITLNNSAANYNSIEIEFVKAGTYGVQKVINPNGKQVTLYLSNWYDTGSLQEIFKKININGTTITHLYGGYRNSGTSGTPTIEIENSVSITKVIGYK